MTPRTRSALADLRSLADAAESADLMLMAHGIRRAVRDIEAELAPVVVDQEDDGDPELVGERIDPAVFDRTPCDAWRGTVVCALRLDHPGNHAWIPR